MTSFFMKLIICPLIVGFAAWFLPNVNYSYFYQPIIIGLLLAGAGTLMEYIFLNRTGIWTSTVMDFVASTLIVYLVTQLFPTASITLGGALVVGFILAVVEHFTHAYLIRSGKVEKSPKYS